MYSPEIPNARTLLVLFKASGLLHKEANRAFAWSDPCGSEKELTMFINIKDLSDDALATLKKAAPHQGPTQMKTPEYEEAFHEFQRKTNWKYLDGGFNAFNTAVLSYRRKKVFNPYKSDSGDRIEKVIIANKEDSLSLQKKVEQSQNFLRRKMVEVC